MGMFELCPDENILNIVKKKKNKKPPIFWGREVGKYLTLCPYVSASHRSGMGDECLAVIGDFESEQNLYMYWMCRYINLTLIQEGLRL